MIQSSQFMGLKMLGGKLVPTPWTIYDIIMPPIVFAMIAGMIVVGVTRELWKRARSRMSSAHRVGV